MDNNGGGMPVNRGSGGMPMNRGGMPANRGGQPQQPKPQRIEHKDVVGEMLNEAMKAVENSDVANDGENKLDVKTATLLNTLFAMVSAIDMKQNIMSAIMIEKGVVSKQEFLQKIEDVRKSHEEQIQRAKSSGQN